VRRYRRQELLAALQNAGFDIVRSTSFVSLLLPAMAASRWLDRRRATPYDPWLELTLPRGLNRACAAALAVERLAIAGGVNWPMGGSLLAVARRRERVS
jgi:hypothetical protein